MSYLMYNIIRKIMEEHMAMMLVDGSREGIVLEETNRKDLAKKEPPPPPIIPKNQKPSESK